MNEIKKSLKNTKNKNISLESALIANTKKLVFLPMNTDWQNIDNLKSLYEIQPKNNSGNSFIGNVYDSESKNSFIYSSVKKQIVTLGLNNMVVWTNDEAVYVSNKFNQTKNLEIKGLKSTEYRPWGYFTILEKSNEYLTKLLTINPNEKLSLQKHHHRSEHWIILEGDGKYHFSDGDYFISDKPAHSPAEL